MVDGISILPQTALAILKYFEQELLQKDTVEIIYFFNNLKNLNIDAGKLLEPVILYGKRNKVKADTKIFPFTHPRTNSVSNSLNEEFVEPSSPAKLVLCEITEDASLLPFAKTQNIKTYKSIKYQKSLVFEDAKTVTEDSKTDECFDAHVILSDLLTEDYE